MVRDNLHDPADLFGAICPAGAVGAAVLMPAANAEAMNEHLKEISTQISAGANAVLVFDNAGWRQPGKQLVVPDNISPLSLPPHNALASTTQGGSRMREFRSYGSVRGRSVMGVPTGMKLVI
jgi:hypothetical protein